MKDQKINKLRELARIACELVWFTQDHLPGSERVRKFEKLKRFVERHVDNGDESLSHTDVASFDITEMKFQNNYDFSCEVSSVEYVGTLDYTICEGEVQIEELSLYKIDSEEAVEDKLLLNHLLDKVQEHIYENEGHIIEEWEIAAAECARDSQEDR